MNNKEIKPHLEIKNKELFVETNKTKETGKTLSYLMDNGYLSFVEKVKNIPYLYKVIFKNEQKISYIFINDIVKASRPDLNRIHDKRFYINKTTKQLKDFLKNNKVHFIVGYCLYDNHVFLYSNSIQTVISKNGNETGAPVDLKWLLRSTLNNESFYVQNTNKEKYELPIITNNFNVLIDVISNNKKDIKVLDNNYDFKQYSDMIDNFILELSNDQDFCDRFNFLTNINKIKRKKFSRQFMTESTRENTIIEQENIVLTPKQFSSAEVMQKVQAYSTINPLKIEEVFHELISYDNQVQIEFKNIVGELYQYHKWNNQEKESFEQYDFLINDKFYFDVKSTWKDESASFYISQKENELRNQIQDNYFIALFYDIHFDDNDELKYKLKFIPNKEINQLDYITTYQYFLNKK